MRKLLLLLVPVALSACDTGGVNSVSLTPVVAGVPGATAVCSVLDPSKLDIALKAYGAAIDAVNLLIDAKVLVPGSPKAKAVADANDKVMAAFNTAEKARALCNATSYQTALDAASGAVAEVRAALHRSN